MNTGKIFICRNCGCQSRPKEKPKGRVTGYKIVEDTCVHCWQRAEQRRYAMRSGYVAGTRQEEL